MSNIFAGCYAGNSIVINDAEKGEKEVMIVKENALFNERVFMSASSVTTKATTV